MENLSKDLAQEIKPEEEPKEERPHHSGKGTRARLNTAAEKMMFSSKFST